MPLNYMAHRRSMQAYPIMVADTMHVHGSLSEDAIDISSPVHINSFCLSPRSLGDDCICMFHICSHFQMNQYKLQVEPNTTPV